MGDLRRTGPRVGYQTPEQANPERAAQHERGPAIEGDAQTLYGNRAVLDGVATTDNPPTEAGGALPTELSARVALQLSQTGEALIALQGVGAQLPAARQDEAVDTAAWVTDLRAMLVAEIASLAPAAGSSPRSSTPGGRCGGSRSGRTPTAAGSGRS